MSIKRLPLIFLIGGIGLKALLVLLWRFFQPPGVGRILINYDPIGSRLAEFVTPLVFDQRRFAPTSAEALFYELVLIIGFGLQCLFLGFLISGIWRWFYSQHAEVASGPHRGL